MEKTYFDRPAQVVFADPDNPGEWLVGIAYRDEIICACCGGIFNIYEIIEEADGVLNPIYLYEDWIDISCEILGGELPEGLTMVNDTLVESIVVSTEDEMAIVNGESTEI